MEKEGKGREREEKEGGESQKETINIGVLVAWLLTD